MNTSMFFSIISQLILDFKDKDKRRFVILSTLLTIGMGMNAVNAQSIKDFGGKLEEYGSKLKEHSTQLHDLNSKFEIFVAYISTQSEKDKEQDDRIKRIAKKHDDQIKKLDDGVKEHDKRIKTLETAKESQG